MSITHKKVRWSEDATPKSHFLDPPRTKLIFIAQTSRLKPYLYVRSLRQWDCEGEEIYESDIVEYRDAQYMVTYEPEICAFVLENPSSVLPAMLIKHSKKIGNYFQDLKLRMIFDLKNPSRKRPSRFLSVLRCKES